MIEKIQNLPPKHFIRLGGSDGKPYIIKHSFSGYYALEQGGCYLNHRTEYQYIGTAAEIAAKIAEMGLKYEKTMQRASDNWLFPFNF